MTENNGFGVLYLVIEKLTKIFHVHFAFFCVNYCGAAVQRKSMLRCAFYCADHIGQLAHAGRLDKNSVGGVVLIHLQQSGTKISY